MNTLLKLHSAELPDNHSHFVGLIVGTYQPDADQPNQGSIATADGRSYKAKLVEQVEAQHFQDLDLSQPMLFRVRPSLTLGVDIILSVIGIEHPNHNQLQHSTDKFSAVSNFYWLDSDDSLRLVESRSGPLSICNQALGSKLLVNLPAIAGWFDRWRSPLSLAWRYLIMSVKQSTAQLSRLKEILVITSVGWLPTIALGAKIRNLTYQTIFKRLGKSVFIQSGAEFFGASNIEIGNGVYIFRNVRIDSRGPNNRVLLAGGVALERGVDIGRLENTGIEIGERTFIGPYTCIGGPGNIKIGKDCLIAAHSGIIANNHTFSELTQPIRDQGITCKGIVIEDDCWLGYGVKVLDGVTIGRGSVIGAGAVITKDIPPYSVAVGVPARPISNRKSNQLVGIKASNYLPKSIANALAEVEKTAELLHQCLQAAKGTTSPHLVWEKLLHALLECIRQFMQVDTVTVLLRSENGHQLAVCATLGLEEEIVEKVRIPIGRGFAGRIAARGESMIVEDLSQVEVVSPILRHKGIRSMVGVPLLAEARMIGVFHVGTYSHRQFSKDDARILQIMGDRLAAAIAPFSMYSQRQLSRDNAQFLRQIGVNQLVEAIAQLLEPAIAYPLISHS